MFEDIVGGFASGRVSRGILAFDFHLKDFVCAFVGVDLGMSKECDEAFLEGAKAAFDFSFGLRGEGATRWLHLWLSMRAGTRCEGRGGRVEELGPKRLRPSV